MRTAYSWRLALALAALPACGDPPPVRAPLPSATSEDAGSDAAAAPAPHGKALLAVAERGRPYGTPIRVVSDGVERFLVFLGTEQFARAAWWVTPGPEVSVQPVVGFPVGVKILGHVTRPGAIYLLLETAGVMDQPAGLTGVWVEPLGSGQVANFSLHESAKLKDVASLEKAVDAWKGDPPSADEDTLVRALAAAAVADAGGAFASDRVDTYQVWQGRFLKPELSVPVGQIVQAGRVPHPVRALLKQMQSEKYCLLDTCEATMGGARVSVRFTAVDGTWRIASIERDAVAPRSEPTQSPALVPMATTQSSTFEVLREHVRATPVLLGQAPLRKSGDDTIGVALLERHGLVAAVKQGLHTEVFPLSSMDIAASKLLSPKFDVAFGDVDGDGITDVAVEVSGTTSDGDPVRYGRVFVGPPASVQVTEMRPDIASDLVALGSTSAQSILEAALRGPNRGVSREDACKLLKGADSVPKFRRIGTSNVRVLTFDEPAMPTFQPTIVDKAKLSARDVEEVGKRCAELVCSGNRPVCSFVNGPYGEYYWFAWAASSDKDKPGRKDALGVLKLSAAAFYEDD